MKKVYKVSILLLLAVLIIGTCVFAIKLNKTHKNSSVNEIAGMNKNGSNSNIEDSNIIKNETNVSYVVLEIEDIEAEEKNQQGLEYKNIKITDKEKIESLMTIINNSTKYESESFIADFGDVPPSATIYMNNGEKFTITAGDEIEDNGKSVNLMTKWHSEDGSNKTLYRVNTKLGEFIEQLANENEDVDNQTKIDWEEYPNDIDNKVNEWIGGINLSSEVGKVSYNLMKKTIYSLSKQKEEIFNKMYFNGDSTEIVDKKSNYSRYCYPDNENNDLSAKYTKKIEYKIAIFNELYYDGYYDLDTLTKMQYEELVQKNDFKHYTNVPKNLYYEINKLLIMNGNNESEKEYKNNSRAKKIKLTINDDKQYIFDLKDTNKVQIFDIDYRQNTIETPVKIDIEVLDEYNGEKTNDVYISDIQFGITSNIPQGR